MATTTINYKGLSGTRGTVTVETTDTLSTIAGAIITAEGLNGDYYADFILDRNNTISFTNNSTDTYAILNFSTTDTLIAILDDSPVTYTKEQRQLQKLELAAVKRTYDSRPATFDVAELPNPYNGNNTDPDDGATTLTDGRPWV